MAVVQAFNRERRFQAEFDALNDANRAQSTYVQKIFSVFFPSIEFLGVLAMGTVIYFGSNLYENGTLTIGTLITAMYLLQLVFQPLQELSDVYGQLQSAGAAMVKIASILDEEPDIRRPARGAAAAAHRRRSRRSTLSSSPTARIRCCTGSRSTSRRAPASRSSASRATASRRSRG